MTERSVSSAWVLPACGLAMGLLAVAAGVQGLGRGMSGAGVALDVLVGISVGALGLLSPVAARQRVLMWSVGAAWLLASVVPVPTMHQGLLVLAIGWFPLGRPGGPVRWVLLPIAVVVALGVGGQLSAGSALILAGVVGAFVGHPARLPARWFSLLSGVVLGAGLMGVSVVNASGPRIDPRTVLVAWQVGLVATSTLHLLAGRLLSMIPADVVHAIAERSRDAGSAARLELMERMLAEALGDPSLHLGTSGPDDSPPRLGGVTLAGAFGPMRVWLTTSSPLAREETVRRPLENALTVATRSIHASLEHERNLVVLRGARRRLLLAGDAERARLAGRLADEVIPELDRALACLGEQSRSIDEELSLSAARDELRRARDEIGSILRGVPPHELGGGRLVDALAGLVKAQAPTGKFVVEGDVAAPAEVEAAVYYLCAEALTNVTKHAAATGVDVRLRHDGAGLTLIVSDDGVGGADPAGGGLTGLRERVDALGGTWELSSVPGEGTVLHAGLPVAQPIRRQGSTM
ncbi:hypothetical protein GA707_13230 [Nostocoides sp. F2B08]|uniref:sensor histidine kinase n=1 Tax=Nostocoides sp. F2B08 TaxID=2653936 RepID=UPI001262EC6A|nr:ATP-binding protein [Tetrasphaera sp. F2B08]KAB7743565.1 hypothetical protein GA707_13230 [Tetrasphaera sp. F2B08]